MQKFKNWLKTNGKSISCVASSLGICRRSIYNFIENKRTPTLEVAHKIEKYTNGAISIYDWLDQNICDTSIKNKIKVAKNKKTKARNSGSLLNPSNNS